LNPPPCLGAASFAWAGHLAALFGVDGQAALSALAALNPSTSSLWPGDLIHHHAAAGLAGCWMGVLPRSRLRVSAQALQLAQAAFLASASNVAAQHGLAMPAFVFLRFDPAALIALFAHHAWLGSILTTGFFVHAPASAKASGFALPPAPSAVLSRLSWLSLWLGFHLTGVFIHNDSSSALASPASQLVFTPTAGALVQAAACRANPAASALFRHLSPTDFIAHHAIALGLHTTSFVLVKGGVDSHGSRFLPDKAEHGFAFACDGPGRGGSCDSSSWDAVYLACFWLLNTLAWALFYVHWLSLPQRAAEALSLLAWFRDSVSATPETERTVVLILLHLGSAGRGVSFRRSRQLWPQVWFLSSRSFS
jgi:photosystem I P700 chlorophyll a apoprotein A2